MSVTVCTDPGVPDKIREKVTRYHGLCLFTSVCLESILDGWSGTF